MALILSNVSFKLLKNQKMNASDTLKPLNIHSKLSNSQKRMKDILSRSGGHSKGLSPPAAKAYCI